jgi:hypothetical protein
VRLINIGIQPIGLTIATNAAKNFAYSVQLPMGNTIRHYCRAHHNLAKIFIFYNLEILRCRAQLYFRDAGKVAAPVAEGPP